MAIYSSRGYLHIGTSVAVSFNKATNQQTPSAGSKCRSDAIHEEEPNQAMIQHERAGGIERHVFMVIVQEKG